MGEIPGYVERAARERDLGQLVLWRKSTSPLNHFGFFLGTAVLCLIGSGVLLWVQSKVDAGLGVWVVLLAIVAVVLILLSLSALLRGWTSHFIFDRGLIQTRNRRVDVAPWAELDEVQEHWGSQINAGKLLILRIIFFDGRRWTVDASSSGPHKDRDEALVAQFLESARRLGRPVTKRPRQERLDTELAPMPGKVFIFGMLVLVSLIGFGLGAVGVNGWVAATAAFLIVGTATRLIGARSAPLRILGWIFIVVGCLTAIGVANVALPQVNGWIIFAGTVVLEVLAYRLLRRSFIALQLALGAARRRRFARRKGWVYAKRRTITVPGPQTAGRLLSVPAAATTVEGRAVVTFEVEGRRVTVFDRVRPKPDMDDKPQTVWLVEPPLAVPPDGAWVDGLTLWYAEEGPDRQGTRPERVAAVAVRLINETTAAARS